MIQIRCRKCNTLLAKEEIRDGYIEIKCPRCNTYNTIDRITIDKTKDNNYSYRR